MSEDPQVEQVLESIRAAVAQLRAFPRAIRLDFSLLVPDGNLYVCFGEPFDIVLLPWAERLRPELEEAPKLAAWERRAWKPREATESDLAHWHERAERGAKR